MDQSFGPAKKGDTALPMSEEQSLEMLALIGGHMSRRHISPTRMGRGVSEPGFRRKATRESRIQAQRWGADRPVLSDQVPPQREASDSSPICVLKLKPPSYARAGTQMGQLH